MISSLEVIDRLPYELAARLESDLFFADIPIIVFEEGNLKTEAERKQAVLTQKSGKRGVAVIVLQVVGTDDYPDVMFNPLLLHPSFQVVEVLELNRDSNGTGKSARKVARRIRDTLKIFGITGIVKTLIPDVPCIEPVNLSGDLGKLVKSYQVNFHCLEDWDERPDMAARPVFAEADDQLTITSGTPDAEIYYTLDDSYPHRGNPKAVLYAGPIDIPDKPGIVVRACAYPAGYTNAFNAGAPIDPDLLSTLPSWTTRQVVT